MTALELLTTLRDRGVRLTPNVTTVRVEAPAGGDSDPQDRVTRPARSL